MTLRIGEECIEQGDDLYDEFAPSCMNWYLLGMIFVKETLSGLKQGTVTELQKLCEWEMGLSCHLAHGK